MSIPYTPTANFGSFPVDLIENGEDALEDLFNDIYKDIYDRALFNNELSTDNQGRLNAGYTKLGITVVDDSDTAPPSYTSGFVLNSDRTHHQALNDLDVKLSGNETRFLNVNSNVGGDVINTGANTYASTFFIANGQSHHGAIETLDTTANTINTTVNNLSSDLTTQTDRINNVTAKVGAGADGASAFDYTSNDFLVDGETLKQGAEKHDAVLAGARRSAESSFELTLRNWEATQTNIEGRGYDTFFDNTKADPATTATIDVDRQKATAPSGGGTLLYFTKETAAATCTKLAARWHASAAVVVKFNLINSTSDGDMATLTGQDSFENAPASGTAIVVKVEIPDGEELYDISFLAQV